MRVKVLLRFHHHQDIQVCQQIGPTAGIGTEEDHTLDLRPTRQCGYDLFERLLESDSVGPACLVKHVSHHRHSIARNDLASIVSCPTVYDKTSRT